MPQNCKSCGADQTKFPIWSQEDIRNYPVLIKGENGEKEFVFSNIFKRKFIWINLFKMEMRDLALILIILGMTLAYAHDTKECFEVLEDRPAACKQMGCTCPIKETIAVTKVNGSVFNFSNEYGVS